MPDPRPSDSPLSPEDDRHGTANSVLGTSGVSRVRVDSESSERASRAWWDADADDYHRTHGEFLGVDSSEGEFVWCPEGLHEGDYAPSR